MSEHIYLLTISLPLVTLLLIFGMRYLSKVRQAKAKFDYDQAHLQLVQETKASIAEVQARLDKIEKILKDVE
jgi:hypothetical protein